MSGDRACRFHGGPQHGEMLPVGDSVDRLRVTGRPRPPKVVDYQQMTASELISTEVFVYSRVFTIDGKPTDDFEYIGRE